MARGGWRRIAAASWKQPLDPQIYGDLEVDATALLAFIEETRRIDGVHVTVTHAVARALGLALSAQPDLNVRLVRGRFRPRESVDVFVVAALGDGEVSGVKLRHVDRMPLTEVASEVGRRVERLRAGEVEVGGPTAAVDALPFFALRWALRFAAWATSDRNWSLRRLGLPRDPFGSAMVSSVGMFGVQKAYGPLSPLYRLPILALVSEVKEKPVVVEGEIVVRPMLTITATLDHRFLDGAHAARLARTVTAYLEDPGAFDPRAPRHPAAEA